MTYNPLFAMACCILAVTFACTFSVIFPLIGPPVVLLVFLTLVGTMIILFRFAPNSNQRFHQPIASSLVMCTAEPARRQVACYRSGY